MDPGSERGRRRTRRPHAVLLAGLASAALCAGVAHPWTRGTADPGCVPLTLLGVRYIRADGSPLPPGAPAAETAKAYVVKDYQVPGGRALVSTQAPPAGSGAVVLESHPCVEVGAPHGGVLDTGPARGDQRTQPSEPSRVVGPDNVRGVEVDANRLRRELREASLGLLMAGDGVALTIRTCRWLRPSNWSRPATAFSSGLGLGSTRVHQDPADYPSPRRPPGTCPSRLRRPCDRVPVHSV